MSTVIEEDWRTASFDMKEDKWEYMLNIMEKYDIEKYLISYETRDKKGNFKPHFHLLLWADKTVKFNLVKKIVEDNNLRGTSGKHGGKRKYASLDKNIPLDELEYFMQYLCKEQNVKFKGISSQLISELKEKAYVKTKQTQFKEQLNIYLEEKSKLKDKDHSEIYEQIKKLIIRFCIREEFNIPPNIKTLILNYLRITKHLNMDTKVELISHFLY